MDENLGLVLVFGIIAVSVCSFLSVAAWSNARARERDAFYRNDAIKKLTETQGSVPEPVLQILRQALEPKPEPVQWPPQEVQKERERFYWNEAMKRIAEGGPGAATELELLRQREARTEFHRQQGLRMGGWIFLAVGGCLTFFLREMVPHRPAYFFGSIPLLMGVILLVYGYGKRDEGRESA